MTTGIPYRKLLMEMLSIPAPSREEQHRADFLEHSMKDFGLPVSRIRNNLLVGDPGRRDDAVRILMNSHLDTVPPGNGWTSDPFSPGLSEGRITGLGSNDAGASVVAMIAAYHRMASRLKPQLNLMLLVSAEEEVSGAGGITAVLPMLGQLDGVIVGEPTGMQPAVAERGLMVIDAEVKGKAGHSAREEGINAIYLAMEDIEQISSLSFPEASEWLPDPGAKVTMISGGSKHNVVPDRCTYVVDVRSNDRYGNEEILSRLRSVCHASLVPRSTRLKPSLLDGDHFLMTSIRTLNLTPAGSSTLSDMALIPFPAVKMGPGESARSHTAGEYILESELDQGVDMYCRFLESVAEVTKRDEGITEGSKLSEEKTDET